ncbi:uncharacterized protein [Dendropsophus ebraccatus]|uniref:uncharacterized protein n=2 Tax=Dendropsophus ebraccatus TaxID=150705 RepID=UPI003831BCC4
MGAQAGRSSSPDRSDTPPPPLPVMAPGQSGPSAAPPVASSSVGSAAFFQPPTSHSPPTAPVSSQQPGFTAPAPTTSQVASMEDKHADSPHKSSHRHRHRSRSSHRPSHRPRSSSSSQDSGSRSHRSSRRRRSRHYSRSSRRSRHSRWRSPSSSEWSSGDTGRSRTRMRLEPPSPRTSCLVPQDDPPIVPSAPVAPPTPLPVPAAPFLPAPPPQPAATGISGAVTGSGYPWPFMPFTSMGAGGQRLMSLVSSSVTPPTWQRHGKAWKAWLQVAGSRDVSSNDDIRLTVTLEYFLQLRDAKVSSSVALRSLSGVAFFLKLHGWPDNTKHFLFRQALKGWKKEHVRREARRPVSYKLLARIVEACSHVCSSTFEEHLFAACFCTAFFGALRIGELLPPSKLKPGGLLCDDVLVSNGSLRLRLRVSKTDQYRKGVWIPIQGVQGSVCPVRCVAAYSAIRPQAHNFFVHADSTPVTRFQFISVFRRCLSAIGIPPGDFSSHSFRIGAATEAARAGLSEVEVQRIGRWRSSCFAGYVRPDLLL